MTSIAFRETPDLLDTLDRNEILKPKRKRKAVTADKFIVVRVTQEFYDKVQFASDLAGVNTSKWVRHAVEEKLNA